ncbi:MAG: winged helix-turn-helix domain-containing protein [Caulobacterales bacterium]|nr:winged helix-turn-helix domain-containing protein [Caulobacterales bacterium]
MTAEAEPSAAVDLAHEPDFRLGALEVCPSASRVRGPAGEHRVEPRVMEVLVVLVRRAGQTVTRDELIDACWGGRIVSDDAVSRAVAQVRGLARGVEPAPFQLETVPRVGFRLAPADAAASPGGAAHPAPVSLPGRTRRRRLWSIVAAAALVLAGAGLGWSWFGRVRAHAQNGRVEVMQFEARTADPEVQRAAADTPQDIVRILTAGGVQTSQEPRKRDDAQSDAELRVAGSVGLEGGKYVITGQIIDRASGIILWADRVERSPQEQAASPGDFAALLAAVLDCTLKDRRLAKAPLSTEVMGLYLNACAGIFFGDDDGQRILAVTRRLVKAAPNFAGAHAMHAIGAALVANSVKTPAESAALHAELQAAAARAVKLDPRAAKAYSALAIGEGVWRDQMQHNWFAEEGYLLKALKYDPELAPARNEYAGLLRSTGRLNEALAFLIASAAADDPRYGSDPRVAMIMAATGDLAGAERKLSEMEAHDRVSQRRMRWTIAFWWDTPSSALQKIKAMADDQTPQHRACLEEFLKTLEVRRSQHARGLPEACGPAMDRNWRVRMLAREGDVDGAFAELEGARMPGGPIVLFYPEMRIVRADPRFWPLVARIGLAAYWQTSGHWPDFCAEPGLPYDCKVMARAATSAPPRTAAR